MDLPFAFWDIPQVRLGAVAEVLGLALVVLVLGAVVTALVLGVAVPLGIRRRFRREEQSRSALQHRLEGLSTCTLEDDMLSDELYEMVERVKMKLNRPPWDRAYASLSAEIKEWMRQTEELARKCEAPPPPPPPQ